LAFFNILLILCVIGIGAVLWLLKTEKDEEKVSLHKLTNNSSESSAPPNFEHDQDAPEADSENAVPPGAGHSLLSKLAALRQKKSKVSKIIEGNNQPEKTSKSKLSTNTIKTLIPKIKEQLANIFSKKKISIDDVPEVTPLPSLKEYLEKEEKQKIPVTDNNSGTAGMTTSSAKNPTAKMPLSKEEEERIENGIQTSSELDELKERYERLDILFTKKSSELDETTKTLENEQKNRKEFNTLKDLLEKELKNAKDKFKITQEELGNTINENEGYKKRIAGLEENISKFENELLEKNGKIDELVKRLQTFASPSTASTPPTPEIPSEEQPESDTTEKYSQEHPSQEITEQSAPMETAVPPQEEGPKGPESESSSELNESTAPVADSTFHGTDHIPKQPIIEGTEPPESETEKSEPRMTDDQNISEESRKDTGYLTLQPDIIGPTPQQDTQEEGGEEKSQNHEAITEAPQPATKETSEPPIPPVQETKIINIIDPEQDNKEDNDNKNNTEKE